MYLDHDNRTTSLVEVRCHFGQKYIKPAVDMLQIVWVAGSEVHLSAPNHLHPQHTFLQPT